MASPETPGLSGSPAGPPSHGRSPARRGLPAFLEEMRRRRVFRAVVVYGAVAFAVLQVVEPVMHGLHLPEWVLSAVVVLLGLGFPLMIGLAWAFDLKRSGVERTPPGSSGPARLRATTLAFIFLGLGLAAAVPGVAYHFVWGAGSKAAPTPSPVAAVNPLADARFQRLTDFDGIEQAAALSGDGRFVAFESDRDGRMDVWVTQVGTGQFVNLTRGGAPELVNPSLRTLGFSPDGTLVTFWARRKSDPVRPDIGIWAAPLLGGQPRPYLDGVAEFDWSADGSRLAYHTPGPGDPMFVSDSGRPSEGRQIFTAPEGLHAHFLVWSPDQAFIYFVQGALPDRMDIWRIRPAGGAPERITDQNSRVSHPVFLDARTLVYLATDPDGFGPWIYSLDVDRRVPRRVSFGIDSFTSLAASADGRRLVATMASPKSTLWRVPLVGAQAEMKAARRISLTTGSGSSPRLGPGYLLYVSSKGASDSLWKLEGDKATELWSAPDARFVGAPAIGRDGHRVAFVTRQGKQTLLRVVNADGTNAQVVARGLELRGSPAWTPDGMSITVASLADGIPRLLGVPLDGGSPTPLAAEHSTDPAWSPEGDILAFSGADVGTTFPIKAVKADASDRPLPALTLTRGARHLVFSPQRRSLLALRGEIRHKDLWQIDLETGTEHQVTRLPPGFDVRDFDVSPDGREIVLEQLQERSDIVLIELPRR